MKNSYIYMLKNQCRVLFKLGFKKIGSPFFEAEIPHQKMMYDQNLNNMETSLYIRLGRLIIPYWPAILVSTISAIIYVVFNSLSIWLTASLINNILTDFDQLLKEHYHNKQNINGINNQLKYWTNELILRENPKETLKVLCLTILTVFVMKNVFLYLKNLALTYVQFNLITNIRNNLFDHFHKLSISFFDKNKSGELTSILVNDVSNMRIALGTSFHKIFIEPINIITLFQSFLSSI